MRKKTIFLFYFIVTFLIPFKVRAYECAIVIDADSGRTLYEKNADERRLIASTTKILTTLVVLNNARLDDTVTVTDEILKAYGSSIYIKPGEKFTVEDLLYGLMLRSGNDAAIALAVYVAGSEEGFAVLMNETAKNIGMLNSSFSNPHGLDDENENKSTVRDMALLMKRAMENEDFRKITSTKKYVTKSNFGSFEWYNKNRLLTDYKYATGGKIGYTTRARHTFVSSATKDEKNLIIATFVDPDRFDTHETLYEKYFSLYKKYTLIDKNNLDINYKNGYRLFTSESFSMLLSDDEANRVKREVSLYENVKHINDGTVIGSVSISLDGVTYKRLKIYADAITVKKSFWTKIKEFLKW